MISVEESRKSEMEAHEKLKEEHSALTKLLEEEKVCRVCRANYIFGLLYVD